MSGTSCPQCDSPVRAGDRTCGRCGYRLLEDGAPVRRPPSPRALAGVGAGLLAVLIAVAVAIAAGGGDGEEAADPPGQRGPQTATRPATMGLQVISPHPLSRRAVEAAIEELYVPMRDDDTAFVACSGRVAKPAHSVRRCEVRYPGGTERRVIVLTNARGNEVLSRP
jgi:hypothetical protein